MKPVPARPADAGRSIRVNLTMPVTRFGFGPFSLDPVEQMIGAPLADLLESLMVAPVQRRPSLAGPAVEVYPLALPPGEGATIPLGQFGEIGFANEDGLLVLTVPWGMVAWLGEKLGDAIVRGPEAGLSLDETARVAQAWVRLRAGMRASFPLGALGECGVEAG
jgi:hypothetical protein